MGLKMNDDIFKLYCEQNKMINNPEWANDDASKDFIADIKLSIALLDEKLPEYRERYRVMQSMQKSFTPEQVDFICYQIGEWYIEWKECIITDLEKGAHRLGYAKEQLKEMICGA